MKIEEKTPSHLPQSSRASDPGAARMAVTRYVPPLQEDLWYRRRPGLRGEGLSAGPGRADC